MSRNSQSMLEIPNGYNYIYALIYAKHYAFLTHFQPTISSRVDHDYRYHLSNNFRMELFFFFPFFSLLQEAACIEPPVSMH